MPARLLREWQAFERLEPWGGMQEDFRTAALMIAAKADRELIETLLPSLRPGEEEDDDGQHH